MPVKVAILWSGILGATSVALLLGCGGSSGSGTNGSGGNGTGGSSVLNLGGTGFTATEFGGYKLGPAFNGETPPGNLGAGGATGASDGCGTTPCRTGSALT
jgi:hypothetical protein